MINSYETPAAYKYIDTAPLEEMSMVGQAYKNLYENALKNYQTYTTTAGDFSSPIAADTEGYQRETVGRLQEGINKINDPEWLKTAEGQALINNMVSNTNYAKLAKYRQSAENAKEWLKAYQSMKAQGKINDQWLDNTPSNWSTDKNGVFNETSPLEYVTAAQLTDPYTNNLQSSYLGAKYMNGAKYNMYGVSEDTLRNTINGNLNNIIQSPQGQKYYQQAQRTALALNPTLRGEDLQKAAVNTFSDMMVAANRDKLVSKPELDQVWMQDRSFAHQRELEQMKEAFQLKLAEAKANSAAAKATGGNGLTVDQQIETDANRGRDNKIYAFANHLNSLINNKAWVAQNGHLAASPISYGGVKFANAGDVVNKTQEYVNARNAYNGLYQQYQDAMIHNKKAAAQTISAKMQPYLKAINQTYPELQRAAEAWYLKNSTNSSIRSLGQPVDNKYNVKGTFSNAVFNSLNNNFDVKMGPGYYGHMIHELLHVNNNGYTTAADGSYKSPETFYNDITKTRNSVIRSDGKNNLTKDIDTGELASAPGAKFVPTQHILTRQGAAGTEGYVAGYLTVPAASMEKYSNLAGIHLTSADRNFLHSHSLFGSQSQIESSTYDDRAVRKLYKNIGGKPITIDKQPYIQIPVYRKLYEPGTSASDFNLDYYKYMTGSSGAKANYNNVMEDDF